MRTDLGFLVLLHKTLPTYQRVYLGVRCVHRHSLLLEIPAKMLAIEYGWTVPFDVETLIEYIGGPELTESKLDIMFVPGLRTGDLGANNGAGTALYNPGERHKCNFNLRRLQVLRR
jgi:hypothetical protein